MLLKPLPYPQAERLISLAHKAPGLNITDLPASPSTCFTYRDQIHPFEDIGLWTEDLIGITGVAEPEQVPALDVTDGTLPLLGVHPTRGRLFTRKDDSPGAPKMALLSYGYWRHRFGGDPTVVGRRLRIAGVLLGMLISAVAMRLMSSVLFGVKPVDALTYAVACLSLPTAAFIASYVPSRRALRVDPAEALRAE